MNSYLKGKIKQNLFFITFNYLKTNTMNNNSVIFEKK